MLARAPRVTRFGRLLTASALAATLALPSTGTAQFAQWTVANGGNGHWYQYVPAISIFQGTSFATAQAAAQSSTHLGLQGYLATVTSQAEQNFLNGAFGYLVGFGATGTAWLGASDAAVEGEWRWLGGPEAGQLVSYTNWLTGQPVNAPGFDDYDLLALHINAQSPPTTYGWTSLTPTDGALGYIVEYGNGRLSTVPEPATNAMLAAGLAAMALMMRRRRAV